jgi:hypothetical protein
MVRRGQVQAPPLIFPSLDHALYGGYKMEMRYANAHLPLYGKGDTPAFIAKRRRTPSNAHLPLLVQSETWQTNVLHYFVIKAGASPILNKLRHAEKLSVSFLLSTKPGAYLSDVGASHFTRLEMIAFGCVSDLYLLFEFLM